MKLSHKIRSFWEEVKLRFRVLKATGTSFVFGGDITPVGRLYAVKIKADGTRENHGLISTKVVTTTGVNAIVDAFQGTFTLNDFKYHGSGTSSTAEAVGNTALGTEVATRATGTTTEGASANIYRTVGTITYGGAFAIVEHGVFSASSGGTLLDRSVFSAINVASTDAIEFTYELTVPAGS